MSDKSVTTKRPQPIDFCPCCKRDMLPGEPPFDLSVDNHVDRCIHGSKISEEMRKNVRWN